MARKGLALATARLVHFTLIQRPEDLQNSVPPGPRSDVSRNRLQRIYWLRPTSDPWGPVGVRNTTPSVRQSGQIQDVLNNIRETPRSQALGRLPVRRVARHILPCRPPPAAGAGSRRDHPRSARVLEPPSANYGPVRPSRQQMRSAALRGTWPPGRAGRTERSAAAAATALLASAHPGDQLRHDLTEPLGDIGVLSRMLTLQRRRRDGQVEILDDPRAGDPERFSRLVVRPDSAVPA